MLIFSRCNKHLVEVSRCDEHSRFPSFSGLRWRCAFLHSQVSVAITAVAIARVAPMAAVVTAATTLWAEDAANQEA